MSIESAIEPSPRTRLAEVARVFLRLSLLGFGGPNAHLALMEHELVTRRKWLDHDRYLNLLAITNLIPGPNSSEVAIHLGLLRAGPLGGLVAGVCFVAPTATMVIALAWLYFEQRTRLALDAWLYGVRPVVIALIAIAGARLTRSAVRDVPSSVLLVLGAAAVVLVPRWEVAAMLVGAVVALIRDRVRKPPASPPSVPGPIAPGAPPTPSSSSSSSPPSTLAFAPVGLPLAFGFTNIAGSVALAALAWTFFRTGALLFGGGYFLLPLLEPHVVAPVGWLTRREFLDGIAITHALPGPITSVCAFFGYRAHGVAGAIVALVAVYVPSFIAVYIAAPLVERARGATRVATALGGVNAVVAGTVLGAAALYAPASIPDIPAAVIALVALVLLGATRVNSAWLILGGLAIGLARAL